jgi:hypothetical protein
MSQRSLGKFVRSALSCVIVLAALLNPSKAGATDPCPTDADQIATDRPDVTNSSLMVPYGSFQAENGLDWAARHDTNALDGPTQDSGSVSLIAVNS